VTTVGEPGVAPVDPDPPIRRTARVRTLRPTRATWPLWAITAGMPLMFLIGAHGLIWPLVSVVLLLRLVRHREATFPWTSAPLVLFVCWTPLSFAATTPSALPIFTYRWLLFAGCLALLVWVINMPTDTLPTDRIVDWLAALWIATIALGYLAQLLPDLDMASPLSTLLGPLGRVDFVARISSWNLADNDEFLTTSYARPAAPWAAANSWGAAVGILTPFFIRSWLVDASRRRRQVGIALLVASAVPIIMSANRGLWIGLVLALVYYAARKAFRGKFGAVAVLFAAVFLVGVALVVTPAGGLVNDRINGSDDSNEARSELYVDAWKGALDSPLVGNGVPRPTNYYENSPPVGTHGLIWYLMFIHGFVGLVLFLGWLGLEVVRSGQVRTKLAWWAHLSLVIALVSVPYYGLLPHVMLMGIAAGIAHREATAARALQAAAHTAHVP
jgi:hypothetical protein